MVPSPPLWAVLGDVLLCLGAGLLLGVVRDGATLAFGSGPVRCFVWDVLVLVWPLRFAADYAVHPFKQWLLARIRKIRHARRHNAQASCKKSGKKPKNVLQNKHTILYN